MTSRLVTIRFSHFCEKARWALDLAGFRYAEEYHCPVFHLPAVKRISRRTTPILVLADQVLGDSTDILRFADAQGAALLPTAPELSREVDEWEDLFDEKLGPAVRRYAYQLLFQAPSSMMVTLFRSAASPGEARWVGPTYPLLRFAMRRSMNINAASAERSRLQMEEILARVEARLADGRRYLVGDAFTAADLTLAALLSPLLGPPEFGAPLPGFNDLPEPFAGAARAAAARPAGQFALRMFREHRRPVPGAPR